MVWGTRSRGSLGACTALRPSLSSATYCIHCPLWLQSWALGCASYTCARRLVAARTVDLNCCAHGKVGCIHKLIPPVPGRCRPVIRCSFAGSGLEPPTTSIPCRCIQRGDSMGIARLMLLLNCRSTRLLPAMSLSRRVVCLGIRGCF